MTTMDLGDSFVFLILLRTGTFALHLKHKQPASLYLTHEANRWVGVLQVVTWCIGVPQRDRWINGPLQITIAHGAGRT
jgi:hypothetical protein